MLHLGAAAVFAVTVWRMTPDNLLFDGFLALFGLIFLWFARSERVAMHDFAEKNPALALMEGAEITEHEKFIAQSKFGREATVLIVDPNNKPATYVPLGQEDADNG